MLLDGRLHLHLRLRVKCGSACGAASSPSRTEALRTEERAEVRTRRGKTGHETGGTSRQTKRAEREGHRRVEERVRCGGRGGRRLRRGAPGGRHRWLLRHLLLWPLLLLLNSAILRHQLRVARSTELPPAAPVALVAPFTASGGRSERAERTRATAIAGAARTGLIRTAPETRALAPTPSLQ